MILARAVCADQRADLELAFRRMGLPTPAGDYLAEKVPHAQVLLTGISAVEGRFLRAMTEGSTAPGFEAYPSYVPGNVAARPGTALLSGRRDQFDRLRHEASAPELTQLRVALGRLLDPVTPAPLRLGKSVLAWGERTFVMGVVNVTPDSFSDGGRFEGPEQAVAHGLALAQAGADVIDVGGESTRPGARAVSADEELARVLPVVRRLSDKTAVPVSIDTTKAQVAREAVAAGALLVNDVSAFGADSAMASVVAQTGAACCLMHMQGAPATMQADPQYSDVVAEVMEGLSRARERALTAGISAERILLDPGIGFGKSLGHNLMLLRRLGDLGQLGSAVVVGTSRKSSLGKLVGGKPPQDRLPASLGSVAAVAVLGGAHMVRVHDVAETRDALAVADALRRGGDGGSSFCSLASSR
jgi:dihydropteroate synthase